MIDLNNDEYRKTLADAADSKDGKIIVEFLKDELDKISFESIDDNRPAEQIGLDFKSTKAVREYLKKCLNYLI